MNLKCSNCGALLARRLVLGLATLTAACASPTASQSTAGAPVTSTGGGPSPSTGATMRWQSGFEVDHPLVGTIWDVVARRRIDEPELTARVQSADVVLFGETHDNPDHHLLQARLLDAFAARHGAPAVVFEMLDRDRQPAVDTSLSAHPGDADALANAVGWASSGWPAWSMYRPVFQSAIAGRGPLLAAGIDRPAAMRIAQEGPTTFDPSLDQAFALHESLPPDQQAAMRSEIREAHCGLLPDAMLDSMVTVQRVRDALLAERLHEGSEKGHGAVLIAGDGHVRRDRGVPAQLERVYATKSLALGLLEVSASIPTPDGYAEDFHARSLPFDFVWFTPRGNEVDHCAELRERMKKHGQ